MSIRRFNFIYPIFIFFITLNYGNIKAHNLTNEDCKNHCSAENNYLIDNDQRILDDVKSDLYSNSCLNSFLCRGLF